MPDSISVISPPRYTQLGLNLANEEEKFREIFRELENDSLA